MQSLTHLHSRDPEKYPSRSAGVSFSNLNVYGFGSSTDCEYRIIPAVIQTCSYNRAIRSPDQKTVGNATFGVFTAVARMIGVGKKLTKIRILREFDGLLESGEMLIVLGRPGRCALSFDETAGAELTLRSSSQRMLHSPQDDCWRDPRVLPRRRQQPAVPRHRSFSFHPISLSSRS